MVEVDPAVFIEPHIVHLKPLPLKGAHAIEHRKVLNGGADNVPAPLFRECRAHPFDGRVAGFSVARGKDELVGAGTQVQSQARPGSFEGLFAFQTQRVPEL